MNQGIIAKLRITRERPEVEGNAALLSDLAALRDNPESPMSERLLYFVLDTGLLPSAMLCNFLSNTIDQTRMTGKRAAMRLEINQRLLAHWRAP